MAPSSRIPSWLPGCGATALSLVFATAACDTGIRTVAGDRGPRGARRRQRRRQQQRRRRRHPRPRAAISSEAAPFQVASCPDPATAAVGDRHRPGRDDPEARGPHADGGLLDRRPPGSRGRRRVGLDRERVPRHRDADRCRIRRGDVDQGGSRHRAAVGRRGCRCGLVRGRRGIWSGSTSRATAVDQRVSGCVGSLVSAFGSLWGGVTGGLIRVDPRTFAVEEVHPDTGAGLKCKVSAAADSVWLGCGAELSRIDPSSNSVRATVTTNGTYATVIAADGAAWVVTGLDPFSVQSPEDAFTTLERFDLETNDLVPGTTMRLVHGAFAGGRLVDGSVVWLSTSFGVEPGAGKLFAFEPASGKVLAAYRHQRGQGLRLQRHRLRVRVAVDRIGNGQRRSPVPAPEPVARRPGRGRLRSRAGPSARARQVARTSAGCRGSCRGTSRWPGGDRRSPASVPPTGPRG